MGSGIRSYPKPTQESILFEKQETQNVKSRKRNVGLGSHPRRPSDQGGVASTAAEESGGHKTTRKMLQEIRLMSPAASNQTQ